MFIDVWYVLFILFVWDHGYLCAVLASVYELYPMVVCTCTSCRCHCVNPDQLNCVSPFIGWGVGWWGLLIYATFILDVFQGRKIFTIVVAAGNCVRCSAVQINAVYLPCGNFLYR